MNITSVISEPSIILNLPSGKTLHTLKYTDGDQEWYHGPTGKDSMVFVSHFNGYVAKDFPDKTTIDITFLDDVVVDDVHHVNVSKRNDKLKLTFQLIIDGSKWKKIINLIYFPQTIVNELSKTKHPAIQTYDVDTSGEYLNYMFDFKIMDSQNVGKAIREILINFNECRQIAEVTLDNMVIHSNGKLIDINPQSGVGINPFALRSFLVSDKKRVKLLAYLIVITFFVVSIASIIADFKELLN